MMNQDSGRYKKDDEKHVLTGSAGLFFCWHGYFLHSVAVFGASVTVTQYTHSTEYYLQ